MGSEIVPASSAAEINRLHHAAQRSAGEALQMARQAGELLAEVKAKLAHGEFLPWLEANCDVGERQAQRYMRLAKNWEALTANTTSTSDLGRLGIDGALAMLAAPKEQNDDDEGAWIEDFWGKFETAWDTMLRPVGGLGEASARKGNRAEKIVSAAFMVADRLTSTYRQDGVPAILRMIRECQDANDHALARAYTAVLEAWQPTTEAKAIPHEEQLSAETDLMEGCALLADSTLDLEAVAASGEIEWAQVEAAADKLGKLLKHLKLSPKAHVDALMAVGDPVLVANATESRERSIDDAAADASAVANATNPYRELANKSPDPVVRAQAAFMAEIWDLAPGVRFTKTSMELPEGLSFENWQQVGRLLASRMPEEMRRRPRA